MLDYFKTLRHQESMALLCSFQTESNLYCESNHTMRNWKCPNDTTVTQLTAQMEVLVNH